MMMCSFVWGIADNTKNKNINQNNAQQTQMVWIHISPLRIGSLSLKVKGMTRKRASATRSHCFNTRTVQVPGRRGRCSGGLYWVYSASTSTVMS